jgi:hypothetical protein
MRKQYVTAEGQRFAVGSTVVSKQSGKEWVVDESMLSHAGNYNVLVVHKPDHPGIINVLRGGAVERKES